jgi:hypothetical protein
MNETAGIVLVIALVLALWWFHSRNPGRGTSVGPRRGGESTDVHCVEVRHRGRACEQVRRIEHLRFLPDEAPRLPLRGCTARNCRCHYVHHDDRRQAERRNPYGRAGSQPPAEAGAERRSMNERRNRIGSTRSPARRK